VLNKIIRFSPRPNADFVLKVMLALLLLCAFGPVRLVVKDDFPITLQSFFVLLAGIAFGWRVGALSVFLYILIGAMGVPVFAGYFGGMGHLTGSFGGFFFGFVIAALVCGYLAEMKGASRPFLSFMIWTLGHILILFFGFFWFRLFDPDWRFLLQDTLPGAAVKSAFGFFLVQLVIRFASKREQYYESK
jgi:biotin transport system substrate-specific component